MNTLRDIWRSGEHTLGGWLAVPSVVTAEATARAGFDFVCIDTQHGAIEYSDAVGMIQAILLGGSRPIVRVPWNEPGIIGKMLDAGAQGIIVPMVNSVAEAQAAVRACRYSPEGSRSYGPGLAAPRVGETSVGGNYMEWAHEHVACIPMIETTQAIDSLDDILAVPGIDAVYVGPADLSITLGLPAGNNDDAPTFTAALETIVAGCVKAGVVPGIHATGALTPKRLGAGFRMVTVTSDLVAMRLGIAAELKTATSAGADETTKGDIY